MAVNEKQIIVVRSFSFYDEDNLVDGDTNFTFFVKRTGTSFAVKGKILTILDSRTGQFFNPNEVAIVNDSTKDILIAVHKKGDGPPAEYWIHSRIKPAEAFELRMQYSIVQLVIAKLAADAGSIPYRISAT